MVLNRDPVTFYNPSIETLSRNSLKDMQIRLLTRQLDNVYNHSALGRLKMDEAGIKPGDINSLEEMSRIPTITRAEIETQVQRSRDPYGGIRAIPKDHRLVVTFEHFNGFPPTSTTIYTALTVSDQAILCEQFVRNLLMIGVEQGQGLVVQGDYGDQFPVALTSLNQPFRFNAGTVLRCPIQCFGAYLIPRHLAGAIDGSRAAYYIHYFKAAHVIGYPEFINGLLDFSKKEGLDFRTTLKSVVVAEKKGVAKEIYNRVTTQWLAKVQNLLVVPENLFFAMDCSEGRGLHVWEDMFIVEALREKSDQAVDPGETGKLTITNLFSEGSPVIRYKTNIDVRLEENPCPCGRSHVRILVGE